jgi:hypothetical protein
MEKQNKDILDILDEGIREAYRRLDVQEKKKEVEKLKTSKTARRTRQVA